MELLPQNMNEWMRGVKRDLQEAKRHRHPSIEGRVAAIEDQLAQLLDPPWRTMETDQGQEVPHDDWVNLEGLEGAFGDPGDGRITYEEPGEFTVATAGVYVGNGNISFDADDATANSGTRGIRVLYDNQHFGLGLSYDRPGSQNTVNMEFQGFLPEGALLAVQVYQSSGEPLDLISTARFNRFMIRRWIPGVGG